MSAILEFVELDAESDAEFSCAVAAVVTKGLIPINGDIVKITIKDRGRRIFL
jgi:hypothetical protein